MIWDKMTFISDFSYFPFQAQRSAININMQLEDWNKSYVESLPLKKINSTLE